jgi:fibronectin type 3 domain-containing protein
LTATGGASQVVLDWTPVSGASSYTVYWGSATGVSSSSTSITSVSTDSYTHTGLNDGTTYYYKVAAVDSAGTGMLSSEVNATTTTVQVNDDDVSVTNTDNDTVAVVTDYALNFDGTNDYVSIPNNPFSNNNTFTIQAWLKPEVVGDGAYHGFLGMQLSGRKPSLWVNTNGDLHYDSYKGSQRFSGTISDGSNKFFTVSEWVHVGWTNDGSNYKFYKNGNLVATETAPDTFNALDNIGYQIGKVDNYFNGQIDEVAIWDVALGIANITALYNSRIGLKASVDSGNYDKSDDLVGYWQFNEGIGSTLTDNTSNSNNGTLNNMDSSPWVTSGLNLTN